MLALKTLFALVRPNAGRSISAVAPPGGSPWVSSVKSLGRGFLSILGLAVASVLALMTIPLTRLTAWLRGQKSASQPIVTDADTYVQVSGLIVRTLNHHGFDLRAVRPGWWANAPLRLVSWMGGEILGPPESRRLECYASTNLSVSFYPSGVLLTGRRRDVTWARGLIAEVVAHSEGLQTSAPAAQALEQRIRRVWRAWDQTTGTAGSSSRLLRSIKTMAGELGRLDVDFDDWQALYRQVLQIERAVRGLPQLLDEKPEPRGGAAAAEVGICEQETVRDVLTEPTPAAPARVETWALPRRSRISSDELFTRIIKEVSSLPAAPQGQATEQRSRLSPRSVTPAAAPRGFGMALMAALVTFNILLVTATLALAQRMSIRGASLTSSAFVVAVGLAALVRWGKSRATPLDRALHTVRQNLS
jgi:hypothetical protein